MRPGPYDQGRPLGVAFFSRKGKGLSLRPQTPGSECPCPGPCCRRTHLFSFLPFKKHFSIFPSTSPHPETQYFSAFKKPVPTRKREFVSLPQAAPKLVQQKRPHGGAVSSPTSSGAGRPTPVGRSPPRLQVDIQTTSRGAKLEGGKDKNESKTNPKTLRTHFTPTKTSATGPIPAVGSPLQTVLSCPRQMSREGSCFGDRPWVSTDSFVMGTVSRSLFNSRRKDDDTVGTVPVAGAPLDTAALG